MPVSCDSFIKEARCTYVLTPYRNLANQSAPFGLDFLGFHGKYGASTTWMGKLIPRLDSRRNGGCPILAVGIKKACVKGYTNE